jgi:hypothetical protein
MPTKMEMDSAHTIEALGAGQFLKRVLSVLHCGEDSNDLPMPGCREVGFSGCAAHCHDCTRAQGGPPCAGQVSVMQVWVNIEYSKKLDGYIILSLIRYEYQKEPTCAVPWALNSATYPCQCLTCDWLSLRALK